MKLRLLLLNLVAAVALFGATTASAQSYYVAFLVTTEEQLSNPASSVGYANITLSADEQSLDYQVVVWSISDIADAHFHIGARGVEGDVALHIQFTDKRQSVGTWRTSDATPLTQEVVTALKTGRLYVNVHTLLNPGGEIRGQFFQPESYTAFLTGAQETPAVTTTAGGIAAVILNPLDSSVYMRGQVANLSSVATAAHIHQAPPGTPGSVVKPTPVSSGSADTLSVRLNMMWTPTDSQNVFTPEDMSALRAGNLYWNVHTALHPSGEVRGQIQKGWTNTADTGMLFIAILSGPQEGADPNPSNGSGTALLMLSPDGKRLRLVSRTTDLSGIVTSGHIHHGQAGTVYPDNVIVNIGATGQLEWTDQTPGHPLSPEDIDSLFAGRYYVNLHTPKWPDGEIRGQIIPLSQRMSSLSGVSDSKPAVTAVSVANYPNPFNPSTTIHYSLPSASDVSLEVRNALGESVAHLDFGPHSAGEHTTTWNATGQPSGVYYIILTTSAGTARCSAVLGK